MKRELQNSSPHKIALLVPVALAAALLLIQVCFRRRQPNPLCGFWQQVPKSSIFSWRGVLQFPLKAFRRQTLATLFILLSTVKLMANESAFDVNDFVGMMGRSTAHWKNITEARDVNTLERAEVLYRKNKMAQFTQKGRLKIPAVVHFIWLGPRPFPPESVENVRTWIANNPSWTIKFWTDRDRDLPCEGMEKVLVKDFTFLKLGNCFEQSQNWGEKSDLLRYEILFQEGGIYVDHDANCLRSFDGLNRGYDFFCGLEAPHEPFVGRSITCGNGVIGSRSHHPTVDKAIHLIAERWESLGEKYRGKDEYSKIEVVMQRTYIALTDAIAETIDCQGNVDIVFPAAYFFAKGEIPALYSQHFYASAWNDYKMRKTNVDRSKERELGKIRRKNRNLTFLLIGLVTFNGLILGISLIKRRRP